MRRHCELAALAIVLSLGSAVPGQQAKKTDVVWKGEIHLGDSPSAYTKLTSAGICMQVPFRAAVAKKYRITVTANDVQTRAGDGHHVEFWAHRQEKDGKGNHDTVIVRYRIKDDSNKEKDFVFETQETEFKETPTYFSVKISVDTSVPFGLWDDFVVKQIKVEEIK